MPNSSPGRQADRVLMDHRTTDTCCSISMVCAISDKRRSIDQSNFTTPGRNARAVTQHQLIGSMLPPDAECEDLIGLRVCVH